MAMLAGLTAVAAVAGLLSILLDPAAAPWGSAAPHTTRQPSSHRPTISPSPKPIPPGGGAEPALDLDYVTVNLTIDPSDLSAASIERTVIHDPQLAGRRAGLVVIFGGGFNPGQGVQVAQEVEHVLATSPAISPIFKVAGYRSFWSGSLLPTEVELNVYLFKN
jgi:hypothetical protein